MTDLESSSTSQPTRPRSRGLGRRQFLGLAGAMVGAGALAACGDNTGRPSGSASGTAGSALSQWYHQYGEAGVQQAVEGYAKAYPGATVTDSELEDEYGRYIYKVELRDTQNLEWDVALDAKTGEVLKDERDN